MAVIEHQYALEQYELAKKVYNDINIIVDNSIDAKNKGKERTKIMRAK